MPPHIGEQNKEVLFRRSLSGESYNIYTYISILVSKNLKKKNKSKKHRNSSLFGEKVKCFYFNCMMLLCVVVRVGLHICARSVLSISWIYLGAFL